jgi:murein DD-endopeptidase MepM/ murein hydrolase activator NlpD
VHGLAVVVLAAACLWPVTTVAGNPLSDRLDAARERQASIRASIMRQDRLIAALDRDAMLVRSALADSAEQLDGIGDDLRALLRHIAKADAGIAKLQRRRESLRRELGQLDTTLGQLDQQIDQGEQDLEARRLAFGARLADAYRTQRTSLLEQILSADSFADVITNAGAYLAYGEQDAAEAQRIAEEQQALDSLRALTSATRYETDRLRRRAEEAAAELRARRAELAAAKARAKRMERRVKAIRTKQLAKARRIASSSERARRIERQHEAAQRQLDRRIRGLVREAQRKAAARRAAARSSRGGAGSPGHSGRFAWPAAGYVTQEFGCTGFSLEPRRGACRHFHDGIDIANGQGTPIRASDDGVVAFVGWNPYDTDPALVVVLGHAGGYSTSYAHMVPKRVVRSGQSVRRGQVVGYMGSTGNSTGTHLHWEVRRGDTAVDPRSVR